MGYSNIKDYANYCIQYNTYEDSNYNVYDFDLWSSNGIYSVLSATPNFGYASQVGYLSSKVNDVDEYINNNKDMIYASILCPPIVILYSIISNIKIDDSYWLSSDSLNSCFVYDSVGDRMDNCMYYELF